MQFRLKLKNLEVSSSHRLPDHEGECKNFHGHNYFISNLIISGEKDEFTGMVVDFKKVKDILNEFDHQCVNDYIDNPTLENMMEHWIEKIEKLGVKVLFMECHETNNCSCIYTIKDNHDIDYHESIRGLI